MVEFNALKKKEKLRGRNPQQPRRWGGGVCKVKEK